jgi:hypothetical protein
MPSISFLTATSKSHSSKEDRLCCDVARMPHYVTVPLQRAEHAPRIPTSPIPAMSLTVLKEYVEEWADNGFRPLPLDHRIWVDRASQGAVEDFSQPLFRAGLLSYELDQKGRAVGVAPSKQGIEFLWRSSSEVASLTGNAAMAQPTAAYDALHTNARLDILATIVHLAPHGDVTLNVLARCLAWPPDAVTRWISKLVSKELVALNSNQTGLIVSSRGHEVLTDLRQFANKIRPKAVREHSPSTDAMRVAVPEVIAHLANLTGCKRGFSGREIGTALNLTPQVLRRINWLQSLVDDGILLSTLCEPDRSDAELRRLSTGTWLYRLARPIEITTSANSSITAIADQIKSRSARVKSPRTPRNTSQRV